MSNPSDPENELSRYLASLSPKELQGYHIAKSHLGMTYQHEKTNGFLEWKKKQSDKPNLPAS
jgi:hypothetical protein